MIFLRAFILGGLLCVLFQLILEKAKLSVAWALTIAFCAGGVLTAAKLMDPILSFGNSGMIIMIIDSGEAVYRWMTAILTEGDYIGLIRYTILNLFVFLMGVLGGRIYGKKKLRNSSDDKENSGH